MKILLHITAHLGGGAGKAISGLIKNLSEFENTVILLEKPENEKYCDECRSSGADVVIASSRDDVFSLMKNADVVILNWWAHPLTVDLIRDIGDIGTRLIIWSHINGLQYPVLTAEFLYLFDGVMFTSPCSLKSGHFTEEQRKRIDSKCSFVYGSGDFQPATHPYKTYYDVKGKITVGYVGTLDFAKLNPGFPMICSEIKKRVSNVVFVLCGKFSNEFQKAFFSDYPELRECTEFKGYVSEPEKELMKFDIFCYPLARENYATTENAVLEAMAAGLPVVVLDNPAESEIIDNDVNGIVAHGIDQFVEKTVELCRNTVEREKLGTAARKAVIEKYDAKVNAAEFISRVENVLINEKQKRDVRSVIGTDIWENFLYFCGDDRDKILQLMNGEDVRLPDIFRSESKGSPMQYLKYFENKKLSELSELIKHSDRS